VYGDHRRYCATVRGTAVVAAVHHSGQRTSVAGALLAHPTIPVECRSGAKQPKVVQRLHDRNIQTARRIVNGRGCNRKEIVNINNVGTPLCYFSPDLLVRSLIPHNLRARRQGFPPAYRAIVENNLSNSVPICRQKAVFGFT
jgi:hypothetical protein